VAAVTAGQKWDDPERAGVKISLHLEQGFLLPKRSEAGQGEDHPFVLMRFMRGRETVSEGTVVVRLIGGIHTNGDKDAGVADIERLLELLLNILNNRGAFTGYKLLGEADWYYGDPDEGVQPHPKYYCTVDLTFKRPPNSTNRR
jgi:hypothetical protein